MTYEEQQDARCRAILDAVNEKTGLGLEYQGPFDGINVHAKSKRRKDYMIIAYGPWPQGLVVKSVLRRRGRSTMYYLCNGQASTGSIEVHFWNEGDFFVPDPVQVTSV